MRFLVSIALCLFAVFALPVNAQEKVGVLMLHGKNPGSPSGADFQILKKKLEADGMMTLAPDMPWSARRYIDGDWNKAMGEISAAIAKLKTDGATKIFLLGHSIGCAGALSYGAQHGGVDGLVLVAPGHAPAFYYSLPYGPNAAVKASVDEARALVAAGKGDTRKDFKDNNQMTPLTPRTTAAAYLSYFDPEGIADMGVAAARMPAAIPVQILIGSDDILAGTVKGYFVDKLPANDGTEFKTIPGNHNSVLNSGKELVADWIRARVAKP